MKLRLGSPISLPTSLAMYEGILDGGGPATGGRSATGGGGGGGRKRKRTAKIYIDEVMERACRLVVSYIFYHPFSDVILNLIITLAHMSYLETTLL
jgi:hypothetical protein